MSAPVWWEATAIDGSARAGVLHTPHGPVLTPGFMPVGTRAAVRGVDVDDLAAVGAEMVLANTYHLMLRPGAGTIEADRRPARLLGMARDRSSPTRGAIRSSR